MTGAKSIRLGGSRLHLRGSVKLRKKLLKRLNRFLIVLMLRKDVLSQGPNFVEFLTSKTRHDFKDVPLTVRLSDFVSIFARFED